MNDNIFDAVFWSFFITSVIGCLLKCSSIIYKFKIKEFNCCGLKIIRDVEDEIKLDEMEENVNKRYIPLNNELNKNHKQSDNTS
jgi:hypothetical protein